MDKTVLLSFEVQSIIITQSLSLRCPLFPQMPVRHLNNFLISLCYVLSTNIFVPLGKIVAFSLVKQVLYQLKNSHVLRPLFSPSKLLVLLQGHAPFLP